MVQLSNYLIDKVNFPTQKLYKCEHGNTVIAVSSSYLGINISIITLETRGRLKLNQNLDIMFHPTIRIYTTFPQYFN